MAYQAQPFRSSINSGADVFTRNHADHLELIEKMNAILERSRTLSDAARPRFERRGQLLPSCLLYTSPSPRDRTRSRMPSSA